MKHAISKKWIANLNWAYNHMPHNSQSSHEYLIHFQSEGFDAREVVM